MYIYDNMWLNYSQNEKMLQTKLVEKIETHILCSGNCLRKSRRLRENVDKYCRAGQATDDNIIRCKHIAYWITKATDTEPEFARCIASPRR